MKTLQLKCTMLLLSLFVMNGMVKAQTLPPAPSHIVIVIMENYSYSDIIGNSLAPYINGLLTDTNTASFTQSYAIEHPSQPNYLDFFSGSNQGNTDDNPPAGYPFNTDNLGSELIAASKTFITYSEDLPSTGYAGVSSGLYVRKHNPAVYWIGSTTHPLPTSVDQPFTNFPVSTNYSSLPTISYVVPNEVNDMHNGSISAGDTWIKNKLDTFRQWTLSNYGLFIIIWDEDDFLGTNNIPTIFYGPMVKHNTYTNHIDLYSVLRTLEDFYGLGHAGAAATSSPITNCWKYPPTTVNNVEKNISLYEMPNPASDFIIFNTHEQPATPLSIVVTDMIGKTVGTYQMTSDRLEVNTSNWNSGIYFYQVSDNSSFHENGKIIITHN